MDLKEGFELLMRLVESEGIRFQVLPAQTLASDLYEYDGGLRGRLYPAYDYSADAEWVERCCDRPMALISGRDAFGVSYALMKTVENPDGSFFYAVIGPYILGESRPDAEQTAKRLGLGIEHAAFLEDYYAGLPLHPDVSAMIQAFFRQLMPEAALTVVHRDNLGAAETASWVPRSASELLRIADSQVNDRYEKEGQILRAVELGDFDAAVDAMRDFGSMHEGQDFEEGAESGRLWMSSLNDLFRQAAQRAQVHPSHINRVATNYSQRIRSASGADQFQQLVVDMLRDYCTLVRDFSQQGYSQLVRDVMNWTEFHLQDAVDLHSLAERFSVNASYLSRRFKQETGLTLTEYVNRRRVARAMSLLRSTDLPVSDVAATVGILDGAYFSRIFRKITGVSPSKYRSAERP